MDTPILAAQAPSDHSILGTSEQKRPLNDLPPDAQRVSYDDMLKADKAEWDRRNPPRNYYDMGWSCLRLSVLGHAQMFWDVLPRAEGAEIGLDPGEFFRRPLQ